MESILIIEDNQECRRILQSYLKTKGYNIFSANNGQMGLGLFVHCKPDLVLTDFQMPNMDGLSVIRRLKEMAPNTPVIMLSGSGRKGLKDKAMLQGARDFIEKPVSLDSLCESISSALEAGPKKCVAQIGLYSGNISVCHRRYSRRWHGGRGRLGRNSSSR